MLPRSKAEADDEARASNPEATPGASHDFREKLASLKRDGIQCRSRGQGVGLGGVKVAPVQGGNDVGLVPVRDDVVAIGDAGQVDVSRRPLDRGLTPDVKESIDGIGSRVVGGLLEEDLGLVGRAGHVRLGILHGILEPAEELRRQGDQTGQAKAAQNCAELVVVVWTL